MPNRTHSVFTVQNIVQTILCILLRKYATWGKKKDIKRSLEDESHIGIHKYKTSLVVQNEKRIAITKNDNDNA